MSHSSRRLNGLDTLRSLAIVLVLMYHYMAFASNEPTFGWGSTAGWIGVDLFFVLSGYLIGNQLFRGVGESKKFSLPVFYARRFLRTLPNYYLVLALYFLIPSVMATKPLPPLWEFLTFTRNINHVPGTDFSHAWSLCIEEQFYLLFPVIVVFAVRFGTSIRFAWMLIGGLILSGIFTRGILWTHFGTLAVGDINGYYPNIYYASFCRADEFLPGIAVAMLRNFHGDIWGKLMAHGKKIFTVGLIASVCMIWLVVNHMYIDGYGYTFFMTAFGYSLISMVFAILLLAALSPSTLLHRIKIPGASYLALWSYAIYLSHKPLEIYLARQMKLIGWSPASISGVAVIFLAIIFVGSLMYSLVERPFMNIRQRYFPDNFVGNDVNNDRPNKALSRNN